MSSTARFWAARVAVATYLAAALVLLGGSPTRAATYIVTTTANSGPGSLRQAILDANAGLIDRIEFGVPAPVPVVIVLAETLPEIVAPVTIDGTTQPGYDGLNRPVVELRGPLAVVSDVVVPAGPGLVFAGGAAGSVVRGLSLTQFTQAIVMTTTETRAEWNWIGVGADGQPRPNGTGVLVEGDANVVGPTNLITDNEENGVRIFANGNVVGPGNVISDNDQNGVEIFGEDNAVIGNLIGLEPSGTAEDGNGQAGVAVGEGAARNRIGGTAAGERNVISGNQSEGIYSAFAEATVILGNFIGTDATGAAGIGNTTGIRLEESPATIGGPAPGAGNVISGSIGLDTGISVEASDGTVIQGNFIGTNASGTQALGNAGAGISLSSGSNYLISDNVISGNGSFGGGGVVLFSPDPGIEATDVSNVIIQGNRIGTTAAGDAPLPNSQGIVLVGTSGAQIGGTEDGQGNLISGNASSGMSLECGGGVGPQGTTVEGNLIGTNASGTLPVANQGNGIEVNCGSGSRIGGPATGAGNVISGNLGHGVFEQGTNEVIQGNLIGVDINGNPLGNGGAGVYIGSSVPEVGGDVPEEGNVIAFNARDGVTIFAGVSNPIRLNSIHDNVELGIDLNDNDVIDPNDPGDADVGANLTQNYPVLTSATVTTGLATIAGVLDTQPGTYAVDFYGNTPGDVEGEAYLGTVTVVVSGGPASFTATNIPVNPGQRIITSTATDTALLNTSEFSAPVIAQVPPTLTTQASPSVPVGGQIFDTATLTGDVDATGTLVFRLYGPGDPSCAGPAVISTVPLVGDQFVYQSPPVTATTAGTYQWVAEYAAGATVVTTACDDPAERVVVTQAAPTITTQASPSVPLGGSVTDRATLGGGFNPTGTITFNLYGPTDPTCAGPAVFTSVQPVVSGGATSAPFSPTAPGTYRWIATYSGDANNLPVSGVCTDAVTVTPLPTTTTSTTTTLPPTTTTSTTSTTTTVAPTTTTSSTTTVPPTTTSTTPTSSTTLTTSTTTTVPPTSTSSTTTTRPPTSTSSTSSTSTSTTTTTRPPTTTSTATTLPRTTTTSTSTTSTTTPPPITTTSSTSTTTTSTTRPPTTTTSTTSTTTTLPPTTTTSSTSTTTTTLPPDPPPGTTVPTTPTTFPPVVTVPTTVALPTSVAVPTSTTASATTLPPTTVTTRPATTTTTVPPLPPGPTLDARNPDGQRNGPPGVGLDVSGSGYQDCTTVYFFFDGVRIGSDTPDAAGNAGAGKLSVPGDTPPGQYQVTSSCSASGGPVRAVTPFLVTDAEFHRSAFVTSLAQPGQVSIELERLAASAGLAGLMILLFAFPCKLFNAAIEENYDEIRGWFRLPARAVDTASTLGRAVGFLVLSVLSAIVLGFLSPDFGPDLNGLVLVVGFTAALIVMSAGFSLPADIALKRRTGSWGKLNFLPGTLLFSIVTVALSRIFDFQPGYFYGAIAGLAFAGAINAKLQGKVTAANWIWALFLSVAAWFARIPVSEAAAQPDASVWWIGVEAGLALTFLWGVENLVVAMLPMRFLDGPKVRAWSKPVWAVLLFLGVFAVIHVLLSPSAGYVGHTTEEVTIGVLIVFAIFGAASVATWAYFRYRPPRAATR